MKFIVAGKVWKWPGDGAWHFIYVDEKRSAKIKKNGGKRIGFGFVPVVCKLGKSEWRTTLFPSKKGPYLLSVHKKIRQAEGVYDGDSVKIKCEIL